MDNSAKGIICGKIINTCNEIKALLSTNGAFDVQLEYLKYLAGELADRRMDASLRDVLAAQDAEWITINHTHVMIDKDGNIVKGPKDFIGKNLKDFEKDKVEEPRVGGAKPTEITYSKSKKLVSHFKRKYKTLEIAAAITIKDGGGRSVKLVSQTLSNIDDFAGKKNSTGNPFDKANFVAQEYGGSGDDWSHSKAIGYVEVDGVRKKADIHWFECDEVGQSGWKVKKYMEG